MKLLTKEIIAKLPALMSTDGKPNNERPIIIKFFHPASSWTWYVLEGSPCEEDGSQDWEFFGLVRGFETEFGYFRLSELEEIMVRGLGVERDMHFGSHCIAEALEKQI